MSPILTLQWQTRAKQHPVNSTLTVIFHLQISSLSILLLGIDIVRYFNTYY